MLFKGANVTTATNNAGGGWHFTFTGNTVPEDNLPKLFTLTLKELIDVENPKLGVSCDGERVYLAGTYLDSTINFYNGDGSTGTDVH